MRLRQLVVLPALLAATPAVAAPPVEVTRFHTPETLAQLGPGAVEVVAAPGIDGGSLENRVWIDAVARELSEAGFGAPSGQGAARIAEVRLTRDIVEGERQRSPVSVGIGGSIGSGGGYYRRRGGSSVGVGVGIGFPIGGGGSREMVESELSVTIRDRATGAPLWEGRSQSRARARSREGDAASVAGRLAEALFEGFPGRAGETIEVR